MEEILILTSFLLTLYSWKSRYFQKSALFIFNLLWFVIFFLYYFRFFGLYSARESTFYMYFLGICSFFVGYVCLQILWKIRKRKSDIDPYYVWKKRLLVVLTIMSLLIYLEKSILAFPLWLSGGMDEVKTSSIVEASLSLGIWDVFFVYVAKPLHSTLILYAVVALFQGAKNKHLYIAAGMLVLFGFVGTASRFSVTEIVISSMAYLFLFSNMTVKHFFYYYRALSVSIILISVLIFLNMSMRGGLGDSLYCYLCGCMPCSDNAILQLDESITYYGIVTFNGVLRIVNQVPSMFGLTPGVREVLDVAYDYMIQFEETTYIGYGIRYNAFISMFTYFYADAGYTGVAILSFIFGGVTSIINKRAFNIPSYSTCALLLYIVLMIFNSMVRAQTFLVPSVMSIVYIFFLIPKEPITIDTQLVAEDSYDD